jgi:hypothetical protein
VFDTEDIRQLVQMLGLHTVDDVLTSVREIFPEEEPPERLRLLLEDIFSDLGAPNALRLPPVDYLAGCSRAQCLVGTMAPHE